MPAYESVKVWTADPNPLASSRRPRPRPVVSRGGGPATEDPRTRTERHVRFATAARLLTVVALGVAMLSWPYGQDCGIGLALYLAATAMIVVGGLWVVVYTWVHRMPRTHAVAMFVALWGVGLIAAEVLPRVGYAKPQPGRPTAWACAAAPRP